MPLFDPAYDTSTTADLTDLTCRKADGQWEVRHLSAGEKAGPFYRVQDTDKWEPRLDTPEGRWAGTKCPTSKDDAIALYHLLHLCKEKPWYLLTFTIKAGKLCDYFISRVKNGQGTQIKIPNKTCAYVNIERMEPLQE